MVAGSHLRGTRVLLMSKSQAARIAAALRRASKDERPALVRINFRPQHGYVVELVRSGHVLDSWESGVPPLTLLDADADPEVEG